MSTIGKMIRWKRFINEKTGRGVIVPVDHGFTKGPIQGLERVKNVHSWLSHPVINGVLAHKGIIERLGHDGCLKGKGIMVHLNGMISTANDPARKIQLTSVHSAVSLGADGVSVDLNFDGVNDDQNVSLLGQVVDAANQYGLPVLTMVSDKLPIDNESKHVDRLRHFIRSSMELGTSAVKVAFELKPVHLPRLLEHIAIDIPIFLAGGGLINDDKNMVEYAKIAIESGAAGLCIGRNVFQRENPSGLLDALAKLF